MSPRKSARGKLPIEYIPPRLQSAFREAAIVLGLSDMEMLQRCIDSGLAEQLRDLRDCLALSKEVFEEPEPETEDEE